MCAKPVYNALWITGVFVAIVVACILLIWINIRKKGKSNTSTLFRMMTNYTQIVSVSMSMNFKLPSSITSIFSPVKQTTEATTVFLSIDCFVKDLNMAIFDQSTFILKVILSSIFPFIFIFFIFMFWLSVKCIFWVVILSKQINSILTILFFFYSTIT